jgi:glycosyltransferase involved in cell wall biosynthesis
LQISEAFGGGVFASVTGLANGLAERGHEVHIAYSRRPQTPTDIAAHIDGAIRLHELELARPIDAKADWQGMLAIRRLLRSIDPDIIHLNSSKAGVLGRVAARLTGHQSRTYYSPRGLSFLQQDSSAPMRRLYEAIEWSMARLGGTIVACSASEYELVRAKIRPRRLVLIDNGIHVDLVPARTDRGDGIVRVGTTAIIKYQKNPLLFANLAQRAKASNVEFVWIGDGDPVQRDLLQRAGVKVTGWIPRVDVLAQMSRLDVYLYPSLWEGMPLALIEAQVCGVPAVVMDAVGNRDIVRNGETGFVGRTFDELSAQLDQLIRAPDLRLRMGTAAREIALKRFDIRRVIDEYEALYLGARASSGAAQVP